MKANTQIKREISKVEAINTKLLKIKTIMLSKNANSTIKILNVVYSI